MRVRVPPSAPAVLLLLSACGGSGTDTGPVIVDVIGGAPVLADPARHALGEADRVLAGAVAQGLVRFDSAGQIEPSLAERWTVIDNGLTYIFRLRPAQWADGHTVQSIEVAAALRRQLARGSRNALAPFLSAIVEVVEMTPEVVEVRLSRPRPELLKLFAQPELAIVGPRRAGGSGPFRASTDKNGTRLRPAIEATAADEDAPRSRPEDDLQLSGHPAAPAIARYAARRSDLVLGGGIDDWPLLAASGVAASTIRIDPAAGLMGLAIVTRAGFLADAESRDVLASVFDRDAISRGFAGVATAETVVPETLDSAAPPTLPDWIVESLARRRASARERVRAWQATSPGPVTIRVALSAGPGVTQLWGQIAAALIEAGTAPVRVALNAPAELRLVDAVAPYDSARWYLATACQPCSPFAQGALDAAREAPTPALRAQALAAADRAIAADVPFVPLTRPLRWSLVSPRLGAWQPNARAWHPLNHLRGGAT